MAQAESLRYKLLMGLAVRRACYGVLRFIMDSSAKGCEVIVSGKIRGQRAKGMKFVDGYMIKTGYPTTYYVNKAIRHVLLRQGNFLFFFSSFFSSFFSLFFFSFFFLFFCLKTNLIYLFFF